MEISIEYENCCGAGNCVRKAPTVFDQDDDGIVVLLDAHPEGEAALQALEAAELCPTWAIIAASDDQEGDIGA